MSRSTLKTTAINAEIRKAQAAAATPPGAAGKQGAPKDKAVAAATSSAMSASTRCISGRSISGEPNTWR